MTPSTDIGKGFSRFQIPRAQDGISTSGRPYLAEVVVQPQGQPEHLAGRILAMVAEPRARRTPGPYCLDTTDRETAGEEMAPVL